eukprot:TRINITY_DN2875_c0_g1_i3.p1 TRINITY_DN2875_c0_g1~~TRINITY_DN2875_c0_g1_i3.p1  ORF type:complete len:203 (-),score=20.12 TRINITY_DN2875_c0_g1_i3:143-751(-)
MCIRDRSTWDLINKTISSTRRKLNSENRKHCFEIFGYDFMVDEEYNVWLIEVNTNPCLEESSRLLRSLLPRMIDDALRLTLDVAFPPFSPPQERRRSIYPVDGYEDEENLWDMLSSSLDNPHHLPERKLRSEYMITINKHHKFKIRKSHLISTSKTAISVKTRKVQRKRRKHFIPITQVLTCLLYTSPSPRDLSTSRMPSSA